MIKESKISLRNVGKLDPLRIDQYIKRGGYNALRKAVTVSPGYVIENITKSGLRGRGGAGFLTGFKEEATKNKGCDNNFCLRYVICNADEGEPGTFKDRIILENDPHSVLEGLLITAYAVGAERGYIYIRGEYYNSIKIVNIALQQAYSAGFMGKNIFKTKFSVNLEIRKGAGSYLCGEELALLESLEGYRGYPRIKPPYPSQVGLFGVPTLVNNVETLAHIPSIILNGPKWYRKMGTKKSPGTKIFTVTGDVKKPGYFEVEMGVKLRDLIFDLAGGIKGKKVFKSALVGGAAGMFVPYSYIDIVMDFDFLDKYGFVLGSGAIIVMNENRSVPKMLRSILDFFASESCGKCVPCRVGTRVLLLKLNNLLKKKYCDVDIDLILKSLLDHGYFMAKSSLCPLGQSPLMSLKSVVKYFKDDLLDNFL